MRLFLRSFYKTAGLAEVSTVGVIDGDKFLMGKRRDNGRYTNPGGHLDPGEDPKAGAKRELVEEAGIDLPLSAFEHLTSEKVTTPTGKQLMIHAFKCNVSGQKTTMKGDPDQEVERWSWMSTKGGLPSEVMENLHSPKNVLLKALGLMEKTAMAFWAGFDKQARKLTSKARADLQEGSFVFPQERRYPIHDENHARAALQRVSQFGSPSEKAAVRSAVHSRYPQIQQEK
jgi:ADP-ribose pyrophosphatase YjhB (NUDIX family)